MEKEKFVPLDVVLKEFIEKIIEEVTPIIHDLCTSLFNKEGDNEDENK